MSKKGPRSEAFNLLTESLSEEVITRYLELAYHVREQELARRRELERRKAAARRGAPPAEQAAPKAGPTKSRSRKPITREDILKLYVADSLGYLEKVRADGWGGLTCAESGRVGGMMTRRMKRLEKGLPLT